MTSEMDWQTADASEPTWARNAMACHELWLAGIDAREVLEGELTTKGYMIKGFHPEQGQPVLEQDQMEKTFVLWPNADIADKVLVAVQRQFMKKFYTDKEEN